MGKTNPVQVQVLAAEKNSKPFPFTFTSTEVFGLLMETVQLVKLIQTEKRDLEAIRADYALRNTFLENIHKETLFVLEKEYHERSLMINAINENAKLLIISGEFAAGQQIMNRLTDFLTSSNPLKTIIELRNSRANFY